MKCENCGYTTSADFQFCKNCGAKAPEVVLPECTTPTLLALLKDKMFLTLCIVLSIGVGVNPFSNVIWVLYVIFLWLLYANAQKNVINPEHIKFISGTIYANYIIKNVVAIMAIVGGIISTTVILAIIILGGGSLAAVDSVIPSFAFNILPIVTVYGIWLIIFLLIGPFFVALGIWSLILNNGGRKKIHALIKSTYQSVENGKEQLKCIDKVDGWLIAFAVAEIFVAIVSISSRDFSRMITSGAMAAAFIIFKKLINKYYPKPEKLK